MFFCLVAQDCLKAFKDAPSPLVEEMDDLAAFCAATEVSVSELEMAYERLQNSPDASGISLALCNSPAGQSLLQFVASCVQRRQFEADVVRTVASVLELTKDEEGLTRDLEAGLDTVVKALKDLSPALGRIDKCEDLLLRSRVIGAGVK